ncbi:MAG: DMT family transporter [Rhodospirillaceae bacterium]|nr:DMT family transporter [Rhodospirillaceae bacterium]
MTETPSAGNQKTGLIAAGAAATSLGVVTTGARVAYDAGLSPATLVAFRVLVGTVAVILLLIALKRGFKIARDARRPAVGLSLGMIMIAYGYMSSVFFIPVSLAALIFYFYPIIVLILSSIADRTVPGLITQAAFFAAFIGLALALGPSFDSLDWRGLLGAGIAAMGATMVMICGAAAARRMDPITLTFYSQISSLPIVLAVMYFAGGPALPEGGVGWAGLGFAAGGYLFGIIFQMLAVRFADPTPVSMIHNLEPLVTLIIAAVILGERLSPLQYAGGGLVLAAVMIAGREMAGRERT